MLFLILYVNWLTCHYQLYSVSAIYNKYENLNNKKFGQK